MLSVPHAGRDYSPALLAAARLPREKLEVLEDRLVDRLVWRAVAAGASALVAQAPRAEIDLNRDAREIDPSMVNPPAASARAAPIGAVAGRAGTGTVADRRIGRDLAAADERRRAGAANRHDPSPLS